MKIGLMVCMILWFGGMFCPLNAHHTLGVNQTGKATESPQIPKTMELQVDHYLITVTVLPGNPVPNQMVRVMTYTKNLETSEPFLGEMEIHAAEKQWIGQSAPFVKEIHLPIDGSHILPVEFSEQGNYVIHLGFTDKGHSYSTSFNLEVGEPASLMGYAVGLLLAGGFIVILWKSRSGRKRLRPV